MNFLLRLAGAYVDAVLATFYPLERERSMADVSADWLADKEAEEEVAEPAWPEQPDPIDHMIALLEDIRNILQSSVVPSAAESPTPVETPAGVGHPTWVDTHFTANELKLASIALQIGARNAEQEPIWWDLAKKLSVAAEIQGNYEAAMK
jgi:hypothetical protein